MAILNMKRLVPPGMQKYAIAGGIMFIGVVAGVGWLLHQQATQQIQDINQQRRRVRLEQEVGGKLSELKKIREDFKSLREATAFLSEVAKLVGRLNINMVSIAALPVERYNEFIRLSVNMELDTTYHEVGVLVSMIENAELFMYVGKMDLILQDRSAALTSRVIARFVVSTISLNETSMEK